jgi:hypothetical protein
LFTADLEQSQSEQRRIQNPHHDDDDDQKQPSTKMPSRFSKTRKARGHVSAGHGRIGEFGLEIVERRRRATGRKERGLA